MPPRRRQGVRRENRHFVPPQPRQQPPPESPPVISIRPLTPPPLSPSSSSSSSPTPLPTPPPSPARPPSPTRPPSPARTPSPPPEEEPERVPRFWRDKEETMHPSCRKYHAKSRKLFSIKVHNGGSFKRYNGKRVWVGGWVRYVDFLHKDELTLVSLIDICRRLGATGLSEYWYKTPMCSLCDGLVWLKTTQEVIDMTLLVPAFKEFEIYILHPSEKDVAQRLAAELYHEYRSMWPKAVIEEIEEDENQGPLLLEWYPAEDNVVSEHPLLIEWHPEDVNGDTVAEEVNGDTVAEEVNGDEEMVNADADHGMEFEVGVADDDVGFTNEEVDILKDCGLLGDDVVMEEPPLVVEEDVLMEEPPLVVEEDIIMEEPPPVVEDVVRGEPPATVVEDVLVDNTPWLEEVAETDEDEEVADPWDEFHHPDPDFDDFDTQEAPQEFADFLAAREADQVQTQFRSQEEAYESLGPLIVDDDDETPDPDLPSSGDDENYVGEDPVLEEAEIEFSADDDEQPLYFNRHVHLRNPVLVPGMRFGSVEDARELIRSLAIYTRKPLKFKRNEKNRLQVVCKHDDCKFYVWCSRVGNTSELVMKKVLNHHCCGNVSRNKNVRVSQLARMYVDRIRRHPTMSLVSFIGDVAAELGCHISIATAFRTIRAAGEILYGNETEQFRNLRNYGQALLDAMPGSTVRIKVAEKKFQGVYICLGPLKAGFKDGCRQFVCLDGCYLKGSFKGEILAATGVDADNGIYPVAWAVVSVENTETWTWFIRLLKADLDMHSGGNQWVVMTDQQKGLLTAIEQELPEAEHRLCVKHLHSNWGGRFQGGTFKDLMWEAARASNIKYHEQAMEKVKAISVDAFTALEKYKKHQWTRCAFKKGANCDMLVNNWAEAFNICIMKARGQPILTMLNTIHQIVMARIVKEHREKEKWRCALCPRVEKLILRRLSLTGNYVTRFSGNFIYEVSTAEHGFIVDLNKEVCSCGLWEVSGVPCVHAVCVFTMENKNPRSFVHACFTRETFLKTYSHFLVPIGGPLLWPKVVADEILPPKVRVLPGRPKKKRRVAAGEIRERKEKEAAEKAKATQQKKARKGQQGVHTTSRKGQINHCKICKQQGHNSRSCPFKNLGGAPQMDGDVQPHSRESMSQPVNGSRPTVGHGIQRGQASSSSQPPLRRSQRGRT